MVGQQKLDHQFAGIPDPLRVRSDHHFRGDGQGAGSDQRSGPFQFHHAQAAGRGRSQIMPVAEMGDGNPRLPGGLKDGHPPFSLNFPPVNGQSNFSHVSLSLLIFTAEIAEESISKKQNPKSILTTSKVLPSVFISNIFLGVLCDLCGETWTPVSTGVTTAQKNIMLIRQYFAFCFNLQNYSLRSLRSPR
jgi:hypothetical protein